jgi:16S rRNA C967 or C1407 C5-methylase (RsmB/RsmF family)
MPLKEIWGKERAEPLGGGDFLRVTPDRHDTDGFFAAAAPPGFVRARAAPST